MLYFLGISLPWRIGLLGMGLISSVAALDWQKSFLHTGFLEWRYYPQSKALTGEQNSLLADFLWQDHWSLADWERVTWRGIAKVQWQRLKPMHKSVVKGTSLEADMLFKLTTGLYVGAGLLWQKDNFWNNESKNQDVYKAPVLLLRYRW